MISGAGTQVQAGGALFHQQFSSDGVAPSRTSGGGFFGAGGNISLALGRSTTASLATEVNSFVLQATDQMTTDWRPTLAVAGVLALGVSL